MHIQEFGFERFLTAGECCVTVSFGSEISLELNTGVRLLKELLEKNPICGVTETVPAYCTLSVHFEPTVIRRKELEKQLLERIGQIRAEDAVRTPGRLKEVPVCYGGEFGPDLEECAAKEGISADELIRRHSEHPYYVFQLGFSPGHPYMSRFEEGFSFGRRATPRLSIPAHSVVAQAGLTNITPFSQACGWYVLGSTPISVTDYSRPEPFFFQAGDWVKLKPVNPGEYERILEANRPGELPPIRVPEGEGIDVLVPGALTTVQDEGRFGYQAYGVTPAGPMDHRAFHLANILAGNRCGEAALELTMTGPALKFNEETVIALTGADLSPELNGVRAESYRPLPVRPGDVLEFGRRRNGCRAYLAVRGGINVPELLGSRSTDLKNSLGGYLGRALKQGDRLPIGKDPEGKTIIPVRFPQPVYDEKEIVLRVVCGPQEDRFTRAGKRSFFNCGAVITEHCDRQGARLDREALEFVTDGSIISDGIPMGAVQVPGDGKPIILLADRQSVGGYAKIGTVIHEDLPKLAQALPGCRVRFVEVSPELAEELYLREAAELKELEKKYVQH